MRAESIDKKEFVLTKQNFVQSERVSQNVFFESSGEYVLPDYMPKVEKLLRAESKILPPSRYMSGGGVQMTGNILHSLIYVGDEGEISATVLPSKYEFTVPYEEGKVPNAIFASPVIDSANCRPCAPRKVTVRSKMRATPRLAYEEDITPFVPSEEGVFMLSGELDTVNMKTLRADNVSVSETVELDIPEKARLIWCGANAAVTDVRTGEGGVQVRGEVYVKLLSVNGTAAEMHTKKIPFEEYLDGELPKKSVATANAYVISTEAGRAEGGALVDAVLTVEAAVYSQCKTDAVFDAYSEKFEMEAEYTKVPVSKLLLCRSSVYNINGRLPQNTLAGYSEMLDAAGASYVDEIVCENGKTTVNGRNNLHFIFKTADGTYSSAEHSLPFKIVLDCESQSAVESVASAAIAGIRTRADGENIVCDIEMALSIRVIEKSETRIVKKADATGAKKCEKSNYPLCLIYPHGESLWSLAKRYHVSPEKLAKVNSINIEKSKYTTPEAISEKKILMLQF
ncbi:MAG: LysM peptidoglycan-binding domain-containing protein [Clostridia bacterium]|nr:LysM peptidoglycan-binding domain-containing protein [Clostridia bacterium]